MRLGPGRLPRTEREILRAAKSTCGSCEALRENRGTSGRDRLPQGFRFWLVARDFEDNARPNPLRNGVLIWVLLCWLVCLPGPTWTPCWPLQSGLHLRSTDGYGGGACSRTRGGASTGSRHSARLLANGTGWRPSGICDRLTPLPNGGGTQTCELIGLAGIAGKCLVAVPGAVWHKDGPDQGDYGGGSSFNNGRARAAALAATNLRVCVGFLNPRMEERVGFPGQRHRLSFRG